VSSDFSLLSRLFPGLAEELAKEGGGKLGEAPGGEFRIETAASGAPTLVFRGRYVHSARDPVREARRFAETLPPAAPAAGGKGIAPGGPVLILGFGLGYAAEAAAEGAPGRPLIVVEKRREILKLALETRNLDRFLSENRIVFVVGGSGEALSGVLSLFENPGGAGKPPDILKNRVLTELDGDWYAGVEGRIRAWTSRDDVNAATLRRFGKRWVRNLARNLEAIRDVPGVRWLEGVLAGAAPNAAPSPGAGCVAGRAGNRLSGVPVFLAAAGPSLDLAGPLLKEIRKRCVIVAVDTSLRFLLSRGIDPDFVVVVDPQYWNARHLDRSAAKRSWLVAESAVYPPVLRHPFRGSLLCRSLFPLGRFIEDQVDPKGALGAGGSVATSAWDFARILGAPAVWIAGLDLSFPELKTHFRGALFETRSHAESNRRLPAETWSVRALRDGQPLIAAAAGGGEVLSDRRLSLYAAWFESRFREYPETRNYSLSPGGIAIPGLELAPPEALLALPERRGEIDRRLEGIFAAMGRDFFDPETARQRSERYEAAKNRLLAGLADIAGEARNAAALAREALEACGGTAGESQSPAGGLDRGEQERLLEKLDTALEAIRNSEVKDVAGFLFPARGTDGGREDPAEDAAATGITGGITTGTALEAGGTPFTRYLEATAGMYHDLEEAAEYQLGVLKPASKTGRPENLVSDERGKPG
jgi:hypothetical protein